MILERVLVATLAALAITLVVDALVFGAIFPGDPAVDCITKSQCSTGWNEFDNDQQTLKERCHDRFGADSDPVLGVSGQENEPPRSFVTVCKLSNGTVRAIETEVPA